VGWLEDFFGKIVSWFDERAANIYNGIVAFINSLVEIWNGWMDALLHPAQAMPSVPALRFIVDWLSNLVDYTRLMYMLVDYVAYAAIVQQALLAQLAIVAVGLGFRAWLVIRRIVLVS
jgi:phage-related minor tail protein